MRKVSLLTPVGMSLLLTLRLGATLMPRALSGRGFALLVLGSMVGVALLLFVFFLMLSLEEGELGRPEMRRFSVFAMAGAALLALARLSQFLGILGLHFAMLRQPLLDLAELAAFAGAFFFCLRLARVAMRSDWSETVRTARIGTWSFGILLLIGVGLAYNSGTGGRLLGSLVGASAFPFVFFLLSLIPYLGGIYFFVGFARNFRDEIDSGAADGLPKGANI